MGSARRSSKAELGKCPAMVACNICKKVDWTWRADCMASSVAESNSDDFLCVWGHLKEDVCAVLPRTIAYLMARIQAAVATVDVKRFRRIPENDVRRPAVCLEVTESASNNYEYFNYVVPMV